MSRLKRVLGVAAFVALVGSPLSAQVFSKCGMTYWSACATFNYVGFESNVLTFDIANTSTVGPDTPATSFIGYVLLLFSNSVVPVTPASVSYRTGDDWDSGTDVGSAEWTTSDPSGNIGGMGIEWSFGAKKDGNALIPGIVARFAVAFDGDIGGVDDWAVHFQGLGDDGEDSDWPKEVPEPGTMLLLASGMLGIAGAARRRRIG